jgi:hypothetical protein
VFFPNLFAPQPSGQLGQGNTMNRGSTANSMGAFLPLIDFGKGRLVKLLRSGANFNCALLDNQGVKCKEIALALIHTLTCASALIGFGDGRNGGFGIGNVAIYGAGPGQMGDSLPYANLGMAVHAVDLTAGYNYACALLNTTQVKYVFPLFDLPLRI